MGQCASCLADLQDAFFDPPQVLLVSTEDGSTVTKSKRDDSTLPMLLLFAATGPTSIVDPSYKLPDDGLGPLGHKMLATQAGGMLAAIAGCAVVWMFKF